MAGLVACSSALWGIEGNLCLCLDAGIALEAYCAPEDCCGAPEREDATEDATTVEGTPHVAEGGCLDIEITSQAPTVLANRSLQGGAPAWPGFAAVAVTHVRPDRNAHSTHPPSPASGCPPWHAGIHTTVLLV